jgi:flagellar basal body-associated protein FliL
MAAAAQSLPDASPKTGGKKKLLVLVVVALLVLGVAAAGAVWFVSKQRM